MVIVLLLVILAPEFFPLPAAKKCLDCSLKMPRLRSE
jgi:hypothetical protein